MVVGERGNQMNVIDQTYTTSDAVRLSGATYRQIDYWLRQGYITIEDAPSGSGNHRHFTRQEVLAIEYMIRRLREAEKILTDLASGELWLEANQSV